MSAADVQISGISDAAGISTEQTLAMRFCEMARRHGDAPAIAGMERDWSYAEALAAARGLSERIVRAGGQAGDRVAVLGKHDGELLVAVLGILLAGRAVVVLNGADPPARMREILSDARPRILLAGAQHLLQAAEIAAGLAVVAMGEATGAVGSTSSGPALFEPLCPAAPADLAWLIYTSGSTGRPKAVMQTHRNILCNVRRLTAGMAIRAEDRIALCAGLSSGQGLSTIWCALLNGACSCPFPVGERGVAGMAAWMEEKRVSVFVSAGSVFRQLVKTLDAGKRFERVRLVRLGAESAGREDVLALQQHFSPEAMLFHGLSSSEAGNITQHCVRLADASQEGGTVAIGRAATDVEILLLDEAGIAVGEGEVGEIVARSAFLSPGYWNDAALTAERFLCGADGVRLFHSGDLARRNERGLLEYAGRKDRQIKIHGLRVELGEVEHGIAGIAAVERAIVMPFGGEQTGGLRLAAFVVLRAGTEPDAAEMRAQMQNALPPHMIPARFVFMDALPLAPGGKTDRHALARMLEKSAGGGGVEPDAAEGPQTQTQRLLAKCWAGALGLGDRAVGRASDFFELGGDSLSAAVIAAKVHAACGVMLDLRAFVVHARLCDLAAFIDDARRKPVAAAPLDPIPRLRPDEPAPLSFAQERIWMHSQTPAESAGYTVACSHCMRGSLDAVALEWALGVLHERHEMLRTTFHAVGGEPGARTAAAVQVRHKRAGRFVLPIEDFSATADPAAEAEAFFKRQAAEPFDLARLPLLRLFLVRLGPEEHWLLRINHHILCVRCPGRFFSGRWRSFMNSASVAGMRRAQ